MTATPTLLSDETSVGRSPRQDTSPLGEAMPANQYTHQYGQKTNGQTAYPHQRPDPVARELTETYREVSWFASTLKQAWPYIVAVVMMIFAAGVAWQKLQASQDKIEAVSKKVDAHDATLGDIREGVAVIRGLIEGQNRQLAAATPIPAYPPQKAASAPPALPPPAAHPPRRTKKPMPATCSGLLCALRN